MYEYEQGLFVPSLAGIVKLIDHDEKGIWTLIDSGAETNVIDWRTVQQFNIPTRPVQNVQKTTISTELEAKIVKDAVSLPEQYKRFEVVFSETDIPLPEHRGRLDHEIRLVEGFKLKKGSIYPLSLKEREEFDKFLNENLACGKIRPSISPQAAPVFFVAKKDGKKRLIQDYRYLNSHMVVDSYPLLDIKTLLDDLASSSYFAKFDVRWGFTNI